MLAQADSSAGLAHLHGDHLGSTRLLTGGAGNAISNSDYNYSPYGVPLNHATSSLTSSRFTGQSLDTDLSLQYHRARWLHTGTASWLSTDPFFDFPGNFGNPYAYVGGNPSNRFDPLGNFTFSEARATFSIASSLTAMSMSISVMVDSVRNRNYAKYAGWKNSTLTALKILGASVWAGLKAIVLRLIVVGVAGVSAGNAWRYFQREFCALFAGNAMFSVIKYLYQVATGQRDFNLYIFGTIILLESAVGTFSTICLFRMLPKRLLGSLSGGSIVTKSASIGYSIAIASPLVNWSHKQLVDYFNNLEKLANAAGWPWS